MANRISAYFRESRDELRKVVWPSRKQTVNDTIMVIALSLFVAVFLGALDFGLNILLDRFIVN